VRGSGRKSESRDCPITLTEALLFFATIFLRFSCLDILRHWLYELRAALRVPKSGTETATVFVLGKKQLVVCIMRQLFLCGLIIRASLILTLRLVVPGSNESLSIFLLSFGSEMGLPKKKLGYLLHNRPASAGTKMCRHARMIFSAGTEPFRRRFPSIVLKYHPAKWDGLP
jgi:hypothetical protein